MFTMAATFLVNSASAEKRYSDNLIPVMTSNTIPSGKVTASESYSTTPAWKAFDGYKYYNEPSNSSSYRAWGTTSTTGWLAYEFPTAKVISKYVIYFGKVTGSSWGGITSPAPTAWTFEGSIDGVNWSILDAQNNQTNWVEGEAKEFAFTNNQLYKIYKLNVTANNGSTKNTVNLSIHELAMMEEVEAAPDSPAHLSATSSENKVELQWTSSIGATGYNIKRATSTGGPYIAIVSSVNGTSYTDLDVTKGTTYYYVVTAVNDVGESGNSNEASSTLQVPVPNVPSSLSTNSENAQVGLTWSAVTNTLSYNVKRATTTGGPYTTIASNVTGTTYTDTNVTNGTTYYYIVTAVNTAGESGNSNEASATPQGPVVQPDTGKAILTVTLTTGLEKEYDLSMTEVNSFISWYEAKAAGTGTAAFAIDKLTNNKGPFKARKDYVIFDKILTFEVNEYDVAE